MDRRHDSRLTLALCGVVVVGTLAAFSSVIHDNFVDYDDQDYVTENPQVQAGLTWSGIRWAFVAAHSANWIPMTWLSHMLDCQWFGLHAGWHHLTNLVLHITSSVVLFLVLKRMTRAIWPSALVGLLFALHPLHVESVAWISERKDVLSAFLFMLTLWAYAVYVEKSIVQSPKSEGEEAGVSVSESPSSILHPSSCSCSPSSSFWSSSLAPYGLSLLFFLLGLLSKPMLVTLPFILLLVDVWPLGRLEIRIHISTFKKVWPLVWEKLPFFAVALASSIVTFCVQKQAGAMVLMESIPLKARVANAGISYCRYLFNTFWPMDLAVFYPMPAAWPGWQVALCVVTLCFVTMLAVSQVRSRPYISVGWLWFLGTLVPVIGIVQVGMQSMADRYTYIPLIGIFLIVAFGINELFERQPEWRLGLSLVCMIVVTLCGMLTATQAGYWHDTATLFEHALAVTSDNAVAEYSVGVARVREGNYPEAYAHFIEAVKIKPDYGEAHNNLGLLFVMNRKLDEGIEHYRLALQAKTDTPELRFNLASALLQKGELDNSAAEFEAALRAKPAFSGARLQLAMILGKQGRLTEARREYESLLKYEPGNADAHFGLGLLLLQTRELDEASKHFQQVLQLHPDAQAHHNLALVLSLQGHSNRALEHYREAVKLNPSWPIALNDLAWALATDPNPEHRNGTEAIGFASKACQLTDKKEARYLGTLDACYAEAGRFEEAIATSRQAEALATNSGQNQIAEAAAARRKLYESKQPYREIRPRL